MTISETTQMNTMSNVGDILSKSLPENITNTSEPISTERFKTNASFIGWKQASGWTEEDELTVEDGLMDFNMDTYFDNWIPGKLYGDWYHSIIIIFLAGFLSFLLGHMKFSLAPVFFVIVILAIIYRTSIKKYRTSIREEVQREHTIQMIENDYESIEWLNSFLDKYWPRLEPAISQMIVERINEELSINPAIPSFIQSIWIDKFTIGVKPPRIEIVKTFQNTDTDIVVMDWGISFTPHDLSDMNSKQLINYVNQAMIIKIKLFGFPISISVHDVSFSTRVRIRLKLMTPFPHIETTNIQLLDIPDVDFVLKLLGNTVFNWETLAIPGLLPLVKELAKKYMGPILLPPFSLQLNIPQLISGSLLSIGILKITLKNVTDLKHFSNISGQSLDLYIGLSFQKKTVYKTRVVKKDLEFVWNESAYVLVSSFIVPLTITIYNKNSDGREKILGKIQYNLNSLHDTPHQKNLTASFLRNSKSVGEFNFDLQFQPTLDQKRLPDGTMENLPELNTGIAKITINSLKILGKQDTKLSTYVELYINANLVLTTATVKNNTNFVWDSPYEAVIANRQKTMVKFVVKKTDNTIVSSMIQSLNDLIDRSQVDKEWLPFVDGLGELKITTCWKPVNLDIGINFNAYTLPIGVVRICINNAEELYHSEKNLKGYFYVRILVNDVPKGRTNTIRFKSDSSWNQSIYISLMSPNQKITLECLSSEMVGHDRSLGKFDIKVFDMIQKNKDDRYTECVDETLKRGHLISKKGSTGVILYYVSFYPTIPVLTLEEIGEIDLINKRKKNLDIKKNDPRRETMSPEDKSKALHQEAEINRLEDMYSNKVQLSLKELMEYNTGVFAFSIIGGNLPQTCCYIQAFFDSNSYPRYVSPQIDSKTIKGNFTGDFVVKELEKSVTTFRITKRNDSSKVDECICEAIVPTNDLVRNCYYKPSIINMTGSGKGILMLQISWFPISISKIPSSDLISNSGELSIYIRSATNLISADRNGKSDPFIKLYVNDSKDLFYKSKCQKKTLNPTWNESCTVSIHNRINSYLRIKVMDWDAGQADDPIGDAIVHLDKIDPHKATDLDVPIIGPNGEDGGILYLGFSFSPKYIISISKRENKIGNMASKGLTAGLQASTTVISGGLGAVGKIKKGIFGDKKNDGKDT